MKEILIFIDDNGKIHHPDNKFVTFSAITFLAKDEYTNFENTFKENFNKVVIKNLTYQEIKGRDFWKIMKSGKEHYGYSDEQRKTILGSIDNFQASIFSIILEKEKLDLSNKNNRDLEKWLDRLLINLLEKIIDTLELKEISINLKVDINSLRVGQYLPEFKSWFKNCFKRNNFYFYKKFEQLKITISEESSLNADSKNSRGIQLADFIAYFIGREISKNRTPLEINETLSNYFNKNVYTFYYRDKRDFPKE